MFNATGYSTGVGLVFARDDRRHPRHPPGGWMGDHRLGFARADEVRVAVARMASSRLEGAMGPEDAPWAEGLALGDGGMYDNLALAAVYQPDRDTPHVRPGVVLVSDGNGQPMLADGARIDLVERLFFAVSRLMESSVGYRVRVVTEDARRGPGRRPRVGGGAWRLVDVVDREPAAALAYAGEDAQTLARLRTDLDAFSAEEAAALQRQGWLAADARLGRQFGEPHLPPPPDLPRLPDLARRLAPGTRNRLLGNR